MIPDEFLQELKYRCDIQTVVSKYVNLRKSGRTLVGLCPFHSEKTPSFHVYPDEQNFYCFGCETGGDVITFIRKIENLDYVEAVAFLAQMAGMEVPQQEDDGGAAALKKRILEINRAAARFYYRCLLSPQGEKGLAYFKKRALSMKTIRRFGLGYAPESWDALLKFLQSQKFSAQEIYAAALCAKSKSGSYYDVFRGRVMFPIIDLRGNVIAFGGRVLDDSKPKYVNSNDTPAFKKSRCLFALNFAKNGNHNACILCEGYMDAIALHQAGFTNAVATLGTALTPEQSRLMARYAKEVVISYDSDAPGQKAAQRAIGLLTRAGMQVRVLRIQGGKDPDEFLRTYGPERFKIQLEKSGNHIEYRLRNARSKYNLEITEQKAEFLREAAAVLSTVESPVEREVYAGRLAQELEVSKESILAESVALVQKNGRAQSRTRMREEIAAARGFRDKINPDASRYLKASRAEENLIVLLYKNPDFLETVQGMIESGDFITSFNKRLFEAVCEEISTYGQVDQARLGSRFTADEMGKIGKLLLTRQVSNTIEEARDCANVILDEKLVHGTDVQDNAGELFQKVVARKRQEEKSEGANNGSR